MHRVSLRRGKGFTVASCHAEGSQASGRLPTFTLCFPSGSESRKMRRMLGSKGALRHKQKGHFSSQLDIKGPEEMTQIFERKDLV